MSFEEMILEEQKPRKTSDVRNLMTGIVKKNWDKEYPGCVQVEILMGESGNTTTQWVRVMQPYCGNGYGQYFLPEINTEVVIGFLAGDINVPIILGCLWNKEDKPPEGKPNDKNSVKSIRTKAGHEILFDETKDKEKIEIKTAGELDICLEDKEKIITIKDNSGENLIQIDGKNGIVTLEAKKKLVLKAGGEEMLCLDGGGKKASLAANTVDIQGKQTLKMKGQTTNLDSNMLTIKAQGPLKVQSGAVLELKGTMCKIN